MDKEKWMLKAVEEAEQALKRGEVPVGCIFVHENTIIATGSNKVTETKNATQHAEIVAIEDIINTCHAKGLDSERIFKDTTLYVTVEPCIMCMAALRLVGISSVVFGCHNERFGGCGSVIDVSSEHQLHNQKPVETAGGVFGHKAIALLKEFYKGDNPNAPESKKKQKT
ncbi:tRNA-specific adenosine deaminase 2-like [Watersipora subatra]|uniref:tRNA-specific adenosine deaminase 2-like n=1 Tax=Watersipora subatra TaxID=2589382 RepID=UPI00355BEC44